MAWTLETLTDLNAMTRSNYREGRVTDLAQAYPEYTLANLFFLNKKATENNGTATFEPLVLESGLNHKFDVNPTETAYAADLAPFQTFDYSAQDAVIQGTTPMKFKFTRWMIDNLEERANQGKEQIVDLLVYRRARAYKDLLKLIENNIAGTPNASDTKAMYPLAYHIVKSNTTPTGGFTGGNPSGFNDSSGINRTTYTNAKNWSFTYAAVSKADLLTGLRNANHYTGFVSPLGLSVDAREYSCVMVTNSAVFLAMNPLLEQQNIQVGDDLYRFQGAVMFGRNPIIPAFSLNSDTSNPIYSINKRGLYPIVWQTDWIKEDEPIRLPNAYGLGMRAYFAGNLECSDPKTQSVGYIG